VDCNEVSEVLTPAVDGELAAEVQTQMREHLKNCPPCRAAYELERLTKRVVIQHVPRRPAPPELLVRVRSQIASTGAASRIKEGGWLRLFTHSFWKPVIALASLAFIIVYLFLPVRSHHLHTQPDDADVFHQVFNTFDKILDGTINPAVKSDDPALVQAYFSPLAPFTVVVRKLTDCRLVGGIVSQYNNQKLAHVVYDHEGNIIYILQAHLKCVMEGHVLSLPPEVRASLITNHYYEKEFTPDCAVVAWVKDSTFYCAIADIKKDDLVACVSNLR